MSLCSAQLSPERCPSVASDNCIAATSAFEVVIFSGAYGRAADYAEVAEVVSSILPDAAIHVLAVRDVLGCDFWAPYEPTAKEILYQVRQGYPYQEAVSRAGSWTYCADTSELQGVIDAIPPCASDKRRIFVGFSNGAITAAAAALHFGAHGLWLASGTVIDEQAAQLRQLDCRIAVTAGTREAYWGGWRGIFGQLDTVSEQILFSGRHAKEPSDVVEQVVRWLAA